MTGLEKIKNQILEEARQEADKKKQDALTDAKKIVDEAEKKAAVIRKDIEEKAKADTKLYQERMHSSADLKRRTILLQTKQTIIQDMIEKSYQSILEAEDSEYFSMMERLLMQSIQPQEGVMYLCERDLGRMPSDFSKKVAELAEQKNGSLTIADTPGQLENGFVLAYGGIEENCTLRAVFDAKRERLQDVVHQKLWRD